MAGLRRFATLIGLAGALAAASPEAGTINGLDTLGSGFDVVRGAKTQGIFRWDLVDTATHRNVEYEKLDVNHEVSDFYRGKFIPKQAVFSSVPSGETKPYTQLFRSYQDYSRYLYKSLGLNEDAAVDTTGAFALDPRLDRVVLELEENYVGMAEQKYRLYELKINPSTVFGHLDVKNHFSAAESGEGIFYVDRESVNDEFRRAVIGLPDPPEDFNVAPEKKGDKFASADEEFGPEVYEAAPGNTPFSAEAGFDADMTAFSGPREHPDKVRPLRENDMVAHVEDAGAGPFDFALGSRARWELMLIHGTLANMSNPMLGAKIHSLMVTARELLSEQESLVGRTIYAIPAGAYDMGEVAEQMKSIKEKMEAIRREKEQLSGSGLVDEGIEEAVNKATGTETPKKSAKEAAEEAKKEKLAAKERALVQEWDDAHWQKREAELRGEAEEFVRAFDAFKSDFLNVVGNNTRAMAWEKYMVAGNIETGGIFQRIEGKFSSLVQKDEVLRFLSAGLSRRLHSILHALRRLQKQALAKKQAPDAEWARQMEKLSPMVEAQEMLAGRLWFLHELPDMAREIATVLRILPDDPVGQLRNETRRQADAYAAFFEEPHGQLWQQGFADSLREEIAKLPAIKAKLQATRMLEESKRAKALAKEAAKAKSAMKSKNDKRRAQENAQYGEKALRTREAKKDVKKEAEAAEARAAEERERMAKETMYKRLMETYGTHYVRTATFGGKIEMTSLIDKKYFGNRPMWELEHQMQRTLLEELKSGGSNFKVLRMLSGDADHMNSNIIFKGGDVSSATEEETLEKWKQSLREDPVAVDFKLAPISQLVRPFVSEYLRLCERGELPDEEEEEAAAEAGVDGPSTQEEKPVVEGENAGGVDSDPNAPPASPEAEAAAEAGSGDADEPKDSEKGPSEEQKQAAESSDSDATASAEEEEELTPEAKLALAQEREAAKEAEEEANARSAGDQTKGAPEKKPETPKKEEEAAEKPAEDAPKQPVEKPAEEAPKQPAEQPAEDAPKQPAEQPAEDAPKQPAEDAPKQPAEQPAGGDAEQPAGRDAEQPAGGDAEQPAGGDAEQPAGGDAEQPAGGDAEQPAGGDAEQPEGPGDEPGAARFRSVGAKITSKQARSGMMCVDQCTQPDLVEQQDCLESCMERVNRRIRDLEKQHVLHARAAEEPDVFLAQATRVGGRKTVDGQSCAAGCTQTQNVDEATACLGRCMASVQTEIAALRQERELALRGAPGSVSFLQLSAGATRAQMTLQEDGDEEATEEPIVTSEEDDEVDQADFKTFPPSPKTVTKVDRTVDDTDGSAWQCMNATQRTESAERFARKRAYLDHLLAEQMANARGLDKLRVKISVVVREKEFYELKVKKEVLQDERDVLPPSKDMYADGNFMFFSEMWLHKCMELFRLRHSFKTLMHRMYGNKLTDAMKDPRRSMLMQCDNDYFQVFGRKPPGVRIAASDAPMRLDDEFAFRDLSEMPEESRSCDYCKAVFKRARQLKNPATRGRIIKPSMSLVKQQAWTKGCMVRGNLTDFNKNPWSGWAVFGFVTPRQLCYQVAGEVEECSKWIQSALREPMCPYSEFRTTRGQMMRKALEVAYDDGCPASLSFNDPQPIEPNCPFENACKCAGFCPMEVNERCYLSTDAMEYWRIVPDPRTPAVADQCFGVGIREGVLYRRTARSFFPKWVKRWFILDKDHGTLTEYLYAGRPRDALLQPFNSFDLKHFDGSISFGSTGYLQFGLTKEGQSAYRMPHFILDIPGEKNTEYWRRRALNWAAHFACAFKKQRRPLVRPEFLTKTIEGIRLTAYTTSLDIA